MMKKNLKRVVALALTAVVAAGSIALPAEAAKKTISRIGNKNRTVSTGSEFELEVRRNGGISEKEQITNHAFEFGKRPNRFMLGSKVGTVSYLKLSASQISDRMLCNFLDLYILIRTH